MKTRRQRLDGCVALWCHTHKCLRHSRVSAKVKRQNTAVFFFFQMPLFTKRNKFTKTSRTTGRISGKTVTHVESGSLSLLPRPGILKAFARLFLPPSGARAVMYSSKPARAATCPTHSFNSCILLILYFPFYCCAARWPDLASPCPSPSALQTFGSGYQCRCFQRSA